MLESWKKIENVRKGGKEWDFKKLYIKAKKAKN